MTEHKNEGRMYQCEYDMENTGGSTGGESIYSAPYICTVCGAGAHSSENLCAPENNEHYEPESR